jgi:hypothetical protein
MKYGTPPHVRFLMSKRVREGATSNINKQDMYVCMCIRPSATEISPMGRFLESFVTYGLFLNT